MWCLDDVLLQEYAGDFSLAPNGEWAVWRRTTQPKDKEEPIHHLWFSSLLEDESYQLTRGDDSATKPTVSPDGKHVAFLCDRLPRDADDDAARSQVYVLRMGGGEAWKVTGLKRPVRQVAWRDAKTLAFLAREDKSQWEHERKEKKDTTFVPDDDAHIPPVRIFQVDLEGKGLRRLTTNRDRIQWIAVSPDGRWALAEHAQRLRHEWDQSSFPEYWLHDLAEGGARRVLTNHKHVTGAWWAPDSSGLYLASERSTHPELLLASVTDVYWLEPTTAKDKLIDLEWDRGLSFAGLTPTPDGFLALLADGCLTRLVRYVRKPRSWRRIEVDTLHQGRMWGLLASLDGTRVVYSHSTTSTPTQWFVARAEASTLGEPKSITKLNPGLKDKKFARAEIVSWEGACGDAVEGVLIYPLDYVEGERRPLVLAIHGGPHWQDPDWWHDSYAYPYHLLAQRGAFVLLPNYHGSSGYGLSFSESISAGNYYSYPVEDLIKGVDAMVERGFADPERLGSMGWSNGAILTTALLVEDSRFKAAAAGAGGSEWISDWGTCAFGDSFLRYYLGATPLEDPGLYQREAPLLKFDRIETPTLFFHGLDDSAVPPHHGWTQYRALQKVGKVETKLVTFPGEPHNLRKLAHKRRKLEEELAWFDRRLFGKKPESNEALRKTSALANMLELSKAAQHEGAYGQMIEGVLAPETIVWGGLRIARFETTRAQYAYFDPKYAPSPCQPNLPATGVTYERAVAYCAWLSEKTGRAFRLPNAEEADKMYGCACGNTLDYWAGYAPNPEDAESLRALAGDRSLLKPVGTFPGSGEDARAFDLNGNAAEWTTGKDGAARVMGGSADQPARPKSDQAHAAPEYIGFRVVESA